jgi:hypothetical protein
VYGQMLSGLIIFGCQMLLMLTIIAENIYFCIADGFKRASVVWV